ncbi:hypothetical protein V1525DRAFT_385258 [Lipomyces kononenkoae]|uniref:Uncharacterized protein n=1 Tax=Lipomyces kononenkoae TaxID=34357 RepID=A0ACC3TB06_LIPKO
MDKPFEGKSVQEKRTFDVRLRVHFQANDWYYTGPDSDRRKILTAITAFGDSMLNKWDTLTAGDNAIDTMTWEDFDKFVLRTIRAPNLVQDDANQSYMNARQREHQTVTEFNVVLRNWERSLPEAYTDNQRKSHLRAKVLEPIQTELRRMEHEPDTYEDFVAHLQKIEDGLAVRQQALRKARKDKAQRDMRDASTSSSRTNDSNWSHGSTWSNNSRSNNSRSRYRGRENGQDRSKQQNDKQDSRKKSDSNRIVDICGHCLKPGHHEDDCWKSTQKKHLIPSANDYMNCL